MESLSESAPKPSWDLHGMFHIFVARTRLNVFDMQSRLRCKWEISLKNHGDKDADHHAAPPLLEGPPPWLIALRRIRWAVAGIWVRQPVAMGHYEKVEVVSLIQQAELGLLGEANLSGKRDERKKAKNGPKFHH